MKLRFLFVRAAAGTLAVGSAAPVNLPYQMQAAEIAATADAGAPARPAPVRASARRGDVELSDGGDLHGEARLLKIGAKGELPCDSGDWATSPLFGPHAALAAALGVKPAGTGNGARDAALASVLSDRPPTGDADSSAFGSVFGNADMPSIASPGGGLFTTGGTPGPAGGTSGVGPIIGGTTPGGTATTGPGPIVAGPGTGGGTGDPSSIGGGPTGPTGTSGPPGGVGGPTDIGSIGGPDTGPAIGGAGDPGTTFPVPNPIQTGGDPDIGGDVGGPNGNSADGGPDGRSATQPIVPGAVPEPASWLTMLAGFALIGCAMRARRRKARFA